MGHRACILKESTHNRTKCHLVICKLDEVVRFGDFKFNLIAEFSATMSVFSRHLCDGHVESQPLEIKRCTLLLSDCYIISFVLRLFHWDLRRATEAQVGVKSWHLVRHALRGTFQMLVTDPILRNHLVRHLPILISCLVEEIWLTHFIPVDYVLYFSHFLPC